MLDNFSRPCMVSSSFQVDFLPLRKTSGTRENILAYVRNHDGGVA